MTEKEFGETTALARLRIAEQAIAASFAYITDEDEKMILEVACGNVNTIISQLEERVKCDAPPADSGG